MLMNNKFEQKKDYVAPLMEVHQFQSQNLLLECSPNPCPEEPHNLGDKAGIILEG